MSAETHRVFVRHDPALFTPEEISSFRPIVRGMHGIVSGGHYLSALAGYDILRRGGNAIDAGVAAGISLNVTRLESAVFGGVAPMILYSRAADSVVTIDGLGVWPRAATIDRFEKEFGGKFPPGGIAQAVVPAAADAWCTALEKYGRLSFADVVAPALEQAESGFPVHEQLHEALVFMAEYADTIPTTRDILMPSGEVPRIGSLLRQPALARTFQAMVDVERRATGTREEKIRAARDWYYKGDPARAYDAFSRRHGGLVRYEDIASYSVTQEPPLRGRFMDRYEVCTCGPWCQGPLFIMVLKLLEGYDLKAMGHNSADYLHCLLECMKVAFADREAYFGDPRFVDVPVDVLISDEYNRNRRQVIDPAKAAPGMPEPGAIPGYKRRSGGGPITDLPEPSMDMNEDTTYIAAIDREGNIFSCTPSDGATRTPIVPEVGTILSMRGVQSRLEWGHPSALAPGKRPRLTPNPALIYQDGRPWMGIGTPGGDTQVQAMVQAFINIAVFGMNIQEAVEAPRVYTHSFPNSFYPFSYRPGHVALEGHLFDQCGPRLAEKGHRVHQWPRLPGKSSVCIVCHDFEVGGLQGAADPRAPSYAVGW